MELYILICKALCSELPTLPLHPDTHTLTHLKRFRNSMEKVSVDLHPQQWVDDEIIILELQSLKNPAQRNWSSLSSLHIYAQCTDSLPKYCDLFQQRGRWIWRNVQICWRFQALTAWDGDQGYHPRCDRKLVGDCMSDYPAVTSLEESSRLKVAPMKVSPGCWSSCVLPLPNNMDLSFLGIYIVCQFW